MQHEMKAVDTVYVILPLCSRNLPIFCSPILIPCHILQVLSPLCPIEIRLFLCSHVVVFQSRTMPHDPVSKIWVSFKPVVPLTKQMIVTGNSPFVCRSSPPCQQFPITASAIPGHRTPLATFGILLRPCLHFHFQELFRPFSFHGIAWQHLHPSPALLGEASREAAREVGGEQEAGEGQSRGRREGAARGPPCKLCQHLMETLSTPSSPGRTIPAGVNRDFILSGQRQAFSARY